MKSFSFKLLCLLGVLAHISSGFAQVSNVLDGAYVKESNITKRVIPYPHLREADVMYTKRVWQRMDLREKINHPYYYPINPIADRKNQFDVVKKALLKDGALVAYGTGPTGDDDEFRYPLSRNQIDSVLNPTKRFPKYDLETNERLPDSIGTVPVESVKVTSYRLKEDWIWDRQRGERYVRIIGIAPEYEIETDEGTKPQTLFWLYYPECRYVLANADAFNPINDAQRRTYEDMFQKRFFNSYIIKESNVYNRSIEAYARGLDALAESERIKHELFLLEHDLWHY